MTPFGFLASRILTHYPSIRALRRGELPPPRMIVLYPTYRCPARCAYCEYREDLGQIDDMPIDLAKELVASASQMGVESVELCGGGEPTCYPYFDELITCILDHGLKLGLLTNGLGLSQRTPNDYALTVLAAKASYIRISLDAADAETYQRVKGFETPVLRRLLEKIRLLVGVRPVSSPCRISAKFLITPENYTEIPSMVRLAQHLGLDSAQFKEVRTTQALTDQQHYIAQALLAQARGDAGLFTVVGDLEPRVMRQKCWLNPLQTLVDADGSVYMCCYFRHRKKTHCIGNINESTLPQIWGSERHRQALASIKVRECGLFDCRFVDYQKLVDQLVVKGDGQFEFL